MTLPIRKWRWAPCAAALLVLGTACDGEDAPRDEACGEPLYGGDATDEAWRTFVDAQGRPTDSSQAVTLESPVPGQTYALDAAPPTWRWTSPLASWLPSHAPRTPARPRETPRAMMAWLGNLLLPSAQAHLPPVTGDFYWVQVTVPGRRCPVELLTSNMEWQLDAATWDVLRAASGQDLRVQVTSAYLVQNRLREGPYRLESPHTIRMEDSR
ncbi:hypothetical protein BHS09_35370 [Myxococcus xanthus]|uniref:Lipoprotein n=1 Tax=Myxococcus xanthus TaxID=34 RepID=A0AAE6KVT5_MYXXA|nr:hypothetical protein [Myxococcus xanthus]QDE71842.1 hypothetical protein BHS09_35370 [Myxococcus xanthus]QDE79123.1 hypothetical protein BHS08_35395 [Myxococcus xanthus]